MEGWCHGVETTSLHCPPRSLVHHLQQAWAWPHPLSKAAALQAISCTLITQARPETPLRALLVCLAYCNTQPHHQHHSSALHNRHMRRDLAPHHHGSSSPPSPSLAFHPRRALLSAPKHTTARTPSPLSRPLTQSHRVSPLPISKGLRTVPAGLVQSQTGPL